MKKIFFLFFLSIFLLLCPCCGKKGNLLPPLVRFPQTVEDVQVVQKPDRIVLTWKNPTAYEDGSTLSVIEKIEIWVLEQVTTGEAQLAEIPPEQFAEMAKLHATITEDMIKESDAQEEAPQGQMEYSFDLTGTDALSKKYTFGIRVKGKKRYSSFSPLMSLKPMVLPLPPTQVKAAMFPDKIEITWDPPLKNRDQSSPPHVEGYNIYRSQGEEEPQRLNDGLIKEEKYKDKNFVFGQTYRYLIRASATDTSPYLESEDSEAAEILTEDTFPPQPPEGLISVAGQDFLALSWDQNKEEDLAGYRVWRLDEGSQEFRLLTPDLIKEAAYNDRAVEKGKRYTYAVTALDTAGNESVKSETISGRIRERMP
jgi:hypothetical protein